MKRGTDIMKLQAAAKPYQKSSRYLSLNWRRRSYCHRFVRRKRFSRITLCLAWPAAFLPKEVLTDSVSVDLGMEGFDLTPVTKLCKELGISHHIIKTQIRQIVFEERKEKKSMFSLCKNAERCFI